MSESTNSRPSQPDIPEGKPLSRRKRHTFAEKYKILQLLDEAGANVTSVSHVTGVKAKTIYEWKAKKDHILAQIDKEKAATKKASTKDTMPALDKMMVAWLDRVLSSKNLLPTQHAISLAAKRFKEQILNSNSREISQNEKNLLGQFNASTSWVTRWTKKHGLVSKQLHGEAGAVDLAKITPRIEELKAKIDRYSAENVYNMDKTGLFYRLTPRQCYVKVQAQGSAWGTKGMTAKDRITLFVATNLTGDRKVPLSVIGKSGTPRCFRNKSVPLKYFSQKKAWSDKPTFRRWFLEVFLPYIRGVTTASPVLLIMDNCGPHGDDIEALDVRGQVKVEFLPPNCTSVHQPMDMGIIAWVKRKYQYRLLGRMLDVLDNSEQYAGVDVGRFQAGTAGVTKGTKAHVLDAIKILNEVWNKLDQKTIARCWDKAQILPDSMKENFDNSIHAKGFDAWMQACVDDIANRIKNMKLSHCSDVVQDKEIMDVMKGLNEIRNDCDIGKKIAEWEDLEADENVASYLQQEEAINVDKEITVEAIICPAHNDLYNSSDEEEEEGSKSPLEQVDASTITSELASFEHRLCDHQCYATANALQDARDALFREIAKAKQVQCMNKRKTQQTNLSVYSFTAKNSKPN